MNRDASKQAVKAFIRANQVDLLAGLSAQGVNRVLAQVTTSISPPSAYYYVGIENVRTTELSMPNFNVIKPPRWARHEMAIHLSDYDIFQVGDDEPYETMHSHFDLLGDRIAEIIRKARYIPSSDACPRFELQYGEGESDQVVTIDSLSLVGEVSAGLATMLYSVIRFTLFECVTDLVD